MAKKNELLANSLLFKGLPPEQLLAISTIGILKRYPKGAASP